MKKMYLMLLILLMTLGFSACGKAGSSLAADRDKLQIVTTIFPEYDWVMNILGEEAQNAEVTMLLDNGVDLHSFQPTSADILKISTCDLFIYVGGESDAWVEDALQEATNKDMVVIDLLDVLGDAVKEEEVVEGMQEEEHDHHHEDGDDHDHEEDEDEDDHDYEEDEDHHHEEDEDHHHEDGEDHDHEEEIEYDEHVWLSLKNTVVLVESISGALQKIDPEQGDTYRINTTSYVEKLEALDREYESAVSAASVKTLLFGDRFPFRYLTDDYGLTYYAAFVGCSAESEASFETVTFLAKKVEELSLPAVLTIEGTDRRIAETVVENTVSKDQQILTMDSMQSTTANDVKNGTTYLSVMENNLTVLKKALGNG